MQLPLGVHNYCKLRFYNKVLSKLIGKKLVRQNINEINLVTSVVAPGPKPPTNTKPRKKLCQKTQREFAQGIPVSIDLGQSNMGQGKT